MVNQNTEPLPWVRWTPKRNPFCWKRAMMMDSPSPMPVLDTSGVVGAGGRGILLIC